MMIDNFKMEKVNFAKMNGLVPVVVQDNHTLQVLMLGFMNEEALERTLSSRIVTFYSRTRKQLWQKGETSGNILRMIEIHLDCDNDSLLIMVNPVNETCHTGSISCFNTQELPPLSYIGRLDKTIIERINYPEDGSYTNNLIHQGVKKIAQKVGEEAVEVVIAALNESNKDYLGEFTDLLYHALVLLHAKQLTLADLANIIDKRHKCKK
ncbi:MAG: phosphoribosyl-AMP cyclohydrolase / phosphoribosyl-ATP pyrophosphohydrolase [Pseudomonadota bacterium]|nr:phosphoribosyl-AMP cyclohydrolase / phosphoribosyl-ATP pyrophosphohydrolase [Pseudomonadota bacterium]